MSRLLDVGNIPGKIHGVVGRRPFLRASLALPFLWSSDAQLQAAASERKARSIILLWLWGGPSQLDTFDPKPKAASEVRGPFSAISTRTPGLMFSELFPRLAARSDKFSVVRSHINHDNSHHISGSIALCGRKGSSGDDGYDPNFGSIVQRVHQTQSEMPPFVAIGNGQPDTAAGKLKAYGGGTWGGETRGFGAM